MRRLLDACAREIYGEWAACHHFELYDEVPGRAADAGCGRHSRRPRLELSPQPVVVRVSLQAATGLIAAAVSSSEHGLMKPHPSIFRAALDLMGIDAATRP